MNKQSGFALIEGIIVIVVLAALVVVGYYVIHSKSSNSNVAPVASTMSSTKAGTSEATTPSGPTVATPAAPQITTASDLNAAMQALNGTSVSSNNVDSSQLTTQSQSF